MRLVFNFGPNRRVNAVEDRLDRDREFSPVFAQLFGVGQHLVVDVRDVPDQLDLVAVT
jgi:hypothetical protein